MITIMTKADCSLVWLVVGETIKYTPIICISINEELFKFGRRSRIIYDANALSVYIIKLVKIPGTKILQVSSIFLGLELYTSIRLIKTSVSYSCEVIFKNECIYIINESTRLCMKIRRSTYNGITSMAGMFKIALIPKNKYEFVIRI